MRMENLKNCLEIHYIRFLYARVNEKCFVNPTPANAVVLRESVYVNLTRLPWSLHLVGS